jgi:hypothetical protein
MFICVNDCLFLILIYIKVITFSIMYLTAISPQFLNLSFKYFLYWSCNSVKSIGFLIYGFCIYFHLYDKKIIYIILYFF